MCVPLEFVKSVRLLVRPLSKYYRGIVLDLETKADEPRKDSSNG